MEIIIVVVLIAALGLAVLTGHTPDSRDTRYSLWPNAGTGPSPSK
jgi:hypothetical protein